MKRWICAIMSILLACLLAMPALAASEAPEITLEPQSPNYPQYSVAIYTVKASGSRLTATWYMEWLGKTYNISELAGGFQDWEAFAGEAYGPRRLDSNTFTYIFEGLEFDLDGAYIWCVIEDGHYSVTSQKARISVGNDNMPPNIVDIPAKLTVEQGSEAEIRCVAQAPENTQLTFLWYETPTGKLQDIQAVNRGTESSDFLFCDTSRLGTRYYICLVQTTSGGLAYSSAVPVTVVKKADPLRITTDKLPEATAGEAYSAKIGCSDPNAEFFIYFNPGKDNQFDSTGLTLGSDGQLSGTPKEAGSYTFCVCASGAANEDYMVYTLTVAEPAAPSTTAPTETPAVITTVPAEKPAATTPAAPTEAEPEEDDEPSAGLPWWSLVLVAVAAAGAGVGAAALLMKKRT